jgi:phosphoribosylformylglycinamidine synthase
MSVMRVFVEKKEPVAVEAATLLSELKSALGLPGLTGLRLFNRYDVEGLSHEDFAQACKTILAQPQLEVAYDALPEDLSGPLVAIELLPGQFDQRADSAAQCIQMMTLGERPYVATARIYAFEGTLSHEELAQIKHYLINPVESREASLSLPDSLKDNPPTPPETPIVTGFIHLDDAGLEALRESWGLAMDADDLRFCQSYFRQESRDPTETELKMLDTYWSDHCRHTTFNTHLTQIEIEPEHIRAVYEDYLGARAGLYPNGERPVTLMDMGTVVAKLRKKAGLMPNLDQSEEINACSVKIKVDVDGAEEDYLLMFKNETHNHPTEMEPFGGASTCLGGAIRDPLSGRGYVYQAMRLSGSGDPRTPVADTLPGKLPQRKLMTTAAAGYSSYGNQVGLSAGHLSEVHHPGFVAKRLEAGAVVAAAPAGNVRRHRPKPGDVVLLVGGQTGRDGCGGATGSSKSHSEESLIQSGAEVQKGNALEGRKMQRLFRNPEAARLIRRCNDFGAGGVSVAIGELADSLFINLDKVPTKYPGLTGTELAISESQERMAVVVAKEDAQRFIELADSENLDATVVAEVTDTGRLVMVWRGETLVDLRRDFLDSAGAPKTARAAIPDHRPPEVLACSALGFTQGLKALAGDLNVCSQKGMVEMFDATAGAATVLLPFGGAYQNTPTQVMAAKIPLIEGTTDTASVMAYGYDPTIAEQSPFYGGYYAVVQSIAKLIAAGGSRRRAYLSFQEYFERLGEDPVRWGKPVGALLGAYKAQMALGVAAIGGKDSMSGSFEDLDVPPSLISFAISTAKASAIISPEFKAPGHYLYLASPELDAHGLPLDQSLCQTFDAVEAAIASGKVVSAWAIGFGGMAEGLMKMAFGNRIGARIEAGDALFDKLCGGILLESTQPLAEFEYIGHTDADYALTYAGQRADLTEIEALWESTLLPFFPLKAETETAAVPTFHHQAAQHRGPAVRVARPRVLIPVFAGSSGEYDLTRAFSAAGAECQTLVVRNRSAEDLMWSMDNFVQQLANSNILAIPSGMAGGDEPAGGANSSRHF